MSSWHGWWVYTSQNGTDSSAIVVLTLRLSVSRREDGVNAGIREQFANEADALVAKEFVKVFNEADHHHDRSSRHPKKEKDSENMHAELQNCGHQRIVNRGTEMQLLLKLIEVLNLA